MYDIYSAIIKILRKEIMNSIEYIIFSFTRSFNGHQLESSR
jgi:hypothetical protein